MVSAGVREGVFTGVGELVIVGVLVTDGDGSGAGDREGTITSVGVAALIGVDVGVAGQPLSTLFTATITHWIKTPLEFGRH